MTTPSKQTVSDAFGRAAQGYDAAAHLQREAAERLAQRFAAGISAENPRVLEIGCGTGYLASCLKLKSPKAEWIFTDLSPPMVAEARRTHGDWPHASFAVMDGEAPAFASGFDLICSSLAFQWFERLGRSLEILTSLLAPGGRLVFATLGAGSFAEWRRACAVRGLPSGVRDYPSPASLREIMPAGGDCSIEHEDLTVSYADSMTFLKALKAIGAGVPRTGYTPLSPGELRATLRGLNEPFAVTYQLILCRYVKLTAKTA